MLDGETDILLARTVDEIIGSFRPGTAPVLYYNENIDHDSILAHETGHRQLCDTTAMGLYISGLSLATIHVSSIDKSQLRNTIQSLIQQCWLCQEGYATFKQAAYLKQLGKITEFKRLIESLPQSYATALGIFDLYSTSVKDSLYHVLSEFPDQGKEPAMWLSLEHVAYVLGRAAMSIPLADILTKSTTLPNYDVLVTVHEDPPDVRLNLLREKCDTAFIIDVAENFFLAVREMEKTQTPRPLDERMDNCARKLCERAGISYEPCYVLDVPKMFKNLGITNFKFTDQRDMSNDESFACETDSRTIHKDWLSKARGTDQLTVDDVARSLDEASSIFSDNRFHSEADIVCELMPIPLSESLYYPVFHLFNEIRVDTKIGEVKPIILLRRTILQCKIDEDPDELSNRIVHRSWTWIMHWSMFKEGTENLISLDYNAFSTKGPVFSPLLPREQTPKGKPTNFSGSSCYSLSKDSSLIEIPGSNSMITEYDCQDIKPTLIITKPTNSILNASLPAASATTCRVSYALLAGAYSHLMNLSHGGIK